MKLIHCGAGNNKFLNGFEIIIRLLSLPIIMQLKRIKNSLSCLLEFYSYKRSSFRQYRELRN